MVTINKSYKPLAWIVTFALLIGGIAPAGVALAQPVVQEPGDPIDDLSPYWSEKAEAGYGNDDLSVRDPFSSEAGPGGMVTAAAATAITSDDFNRANLNTNRWTFVNPLDDGRVALVGAGTGDASLRLTVPAGASHDPHQVNRSVRVMQDIANGDFAVEVKFDSQPIAGYQAQGIIVEQDEDNWLRFDIQSDGGTMRLFTAKTEAGVTTPTGNPPIPPAAVSYLRLSRAGNTWTAAFSSDGTNWLEDYQVSFSHALTMSGIGLFAANARIGDQPAPAFTAVTDYIYNIADLPADGDSGAAPADTIAPLQYSITRDAGETSLTVRWYTDEPATGKLHYGPTNAYGSTVTGASGVYAHEVTIPGLVAGETYHYQVASADGNANETQSGDFSIVFAPNNVDGPNIFLWYGENQTFGVNGDVQAWVNILGNATDPDGVTAMRYRLNGGPERLLNIGPDGRRLENANDFNVDLATADLEEGANTLEIIAYDGVTPTANSNTLSVTVEYAPGGVPGFPYTVDWSGLSQDAEIQEVAQVVDGKWTLDEVGVRTAEPGYDRNLGFGDVFWNDYEVTVPLVLHEIPAEEYGVGVVLRWEGHTDFPRTCSQPKCGWLPLGVMAWYSNGRLQLYGNGQNLASALPRVLSLETTYILKARVETTDAGAVYSLKLWEEGEPEPEAWEVTGQEELSDPQRGSAMLISDEVDVSFGNVMVTRVGDGSNRRPTANNDAAYAAPGGTMLVDVLANDTDAGGLLDPTTVEIVSNPGNGTVSVNGTTGIVTYSHNGSAATSDSFTYRVKDDEGMFSNAATVSLTITDDIPDQIQSDDFNACTLRPQWSFTDPLGGGSHELIGSGTGDAYLTLSVPGGTVYDVWGSEGNEALRVMQAAPNTDFEVEVGFNTEPSGGSNDQGLVVEQDSENYLRFDVYHNGTALRALMGRVIDNQRGTLVNKVIPAGGGERIRVVRSGNLWTMEYYNSQASAWTTVGSFSQSLQVNAVGIMAANPGGEAFTAEADYFFNTAAPIEPEDGSRNEVTVAVEGFGRVEVTPAASEDGYYACGTEVTLRAVADAGNKFQKWGGDITGSDNPAVVTIDGPVNVTATFVDANVDTTPPVITLAGANPLTLAVGSAYNEPGYDATDNLDGDLTDEVTVSGSVNVDVVGVYTLTYSVTDSAGNVGTATRLVNVVAESVDTTPPVIALAGDNPLILALGTPYVEPGYTATDDVNGDLTDDVTVSGTVDVNTAGTYTLVYSVADAAGNTATVTRTVEVTSTPYLPLYLPLIRN